MISRRYRRLTPTASRHYTTRARTAWEQQVLEVLDTGWKWRHNIESGEQRCTINQEVAYPTSVLQSMLRRLLNRLPRTPTLLDSRSQILPALARECDSADDSADPRTPRRSGETHVLFFDGGSRVTLDQEEFEQ
jgi:hypothetical protein